MIRTLLLFSNKFCKFKYYKDLAKQINYPIPKLNHELGFLQHEKCWLLGYRLKSSLPLKPEQQASSQNTVQITSDINSLSGQKPMEENVSMEFEYDPLAKQQANFGDIQKYANKNDLDICAADLEAKELTLIPLRQQIYRKFYQQKLYKAKSTGKKHKQIRVPESIQDHDILNKVANIRSLIKKGEFKFKIYSENDSAKSESKVKRICEYLGRKPKISIQQFQIQQKLKGQRRIVIERWNTTLDFSEESKVDYEKINKKWRRKILNQKIQKQKESKNQTKIFDFEGLQNESIEIQREVLKDLRQAKMSFPSKFKEYSQMEDILQSGDSKHLLIQVANQRGNFKKRVERIRSLKQRNNDFINQPVDQEESQDQKTDQREIYAQKILKKQLNSRSVEDILDEIQETKKKKSQLGPFQLTKLKNLENQLKNIFRKKIIQ